MARWRPYAAGSPKLTEHIAIGGAVYSVSGELLAQATATPVVLVVMTRDRDLYHSCAELQRVYQLTRVQAWVAALLAERMSNDEIARELHVTVHTARRHTERVLHKLGIDRRTKVRPKLLRLMQRNEAAARRARQRGVGGADGVGGVGGVDGAHDSSEPLALAVADGAVPVVETPTPVAVRAIADDQRREPGESPEWQSRGSKESMVVLLAREHDRKVVCDALAGDVTVHFAQRPADLHPPWPAGAPAGVLIELPGEVESELEHALEVLRHTAPTVPAWAYIPVKHNAMKEVVRFVARGLTTDVVMADGDLRAQFRALLRDSYARSELAALRGVWEGWVGPSAREIVSAVIDASVGAAMIRDLARRLNRSPRVLRQQVSELGLPPTHRVLILCRLLRAMHRLDQPGASAKGVASELGYQSSHLLAQQLHRNTGLYISGARAGGHFAELADLVQEELAMLRDRAQRSAHGAAQQLAPRDVQPSGDGSCQR